MAGNLYEQAAEAPGGDIQGHQQGRSNIKWGKVVEMNPVECKIRVELKEQEGLVTYWLQMTYPKTLHDKCYWMPDIDEPRYCQNDEAGEEAPELGAFYNPQVLPHEPDVDKWEIYWRDCSYVKYHRKRHKMEINVRGELEVTAKELILNVKKLTINAAEPVTINGKEVVVVSPDALDNSGDFMVSSGQKPGSVVIKEPCWDGETALVGDLLNLRIKG